MRGKGGSTDDEERSEEREERVVERGEGRRGRKRREGECIDEEEVEG